MLKRAFDIVTSACGLLLLSPLLILVALLVRLSCGRPVLFRHVRVGRGGKDFVLFKFRTMTVAPEKEGGAFDAGDASRITLLGRFLRRSKLDELPQLWNVLKGDMSLVGPRPEVRKWVEAYPERWAVVHRVRPGITDPASIVYRHEERLLAASDDPDQAYREEILPHKLDLYERYVYHPTFLGDMGILVRTLFCLPGTGRADESDAEQ